MAIIKCKMCGGDLEVIPGVTVAECEFCGTRQTLPKADGEVIRNLFNRANALRLKCEFDKAEQIYEKILQENDAESEAHWGIVLCKYGIEYVEDPKTYKRIPTCHRTSYDAVTADGDYLAAVEYADAVQRGVYQTEAKAIDEIQKNILRIVKDEKPFDVFICYKETDENGRRTIDSSIANDIYYQLTQEGLKVFYAAITLEDKLGQAFEPYIFAALNSAKVMLVIGTKPQYFSAVWVKNEWSRFLKLMKSDRSKLLIPCYKDMDAYELPEEFAHLQAQDMSKIGFINDVVRGIRKVTVKDEPKATVVKETVFTGGSANTAALLKRVFMFLEDGDFNSADEYCEKVLDMDPECAEAYLGKLMSVMRVKTRAGLKDCEMPFDRSNHYQKAIRFADDKLRAVLEDAIRHIRERNERTRLEEIYSRATKTMSAAAAEDAYKKAAQLFESIRDYRNSAALAQQCAEQAEAARKNGIYEAAKAKMAAKRYPEAIDLFLKIPGWKDADAHIVSCREKLAQIQAKEEADRQERERKAELARAEAAAAAKKREKRNTVCAVCAVILVCAGVLAYLTVTIFIPNSHYSTGLALLEEGRFDEAYAVFEALGGYRDSAQLCRETRYQQALAHWEKKEYEISNPIFQELGDYKDSGQRIHTHAYAAEIVTEPGCETKGEKKFACTGCPYFYTQPIDATGHSYEEAQVTKEPTCTEKGEQRAVCAACGKTVTEALAMKEHTYSGAVTKAATCEGTGIKTYSCRCGKSYTETIQATGHSYNGGTVTTDPTCETAGVKTYSCHCGKSYTETIKATGHNYSEATCTAASVCANCNHTRQAALGHSNQNNRCSRCNQNLTEVISVVLDEMGGSDNHVLYFSKDYKPAHGTYRCTIRVLAVDTKYVDDDRMSSCHPKIRAKTGDYGLGMFEKKYPDVYAGAVFTFDIKVTADYGYNVEANYCRIDVKIEPVD